MKKTNGARRIHGLIAGAAIALGASQAAQAANWLELQGNEAPGAKAVTIWGFVQPQYVHNEGGAVTGLKGPAAPYNGQTAVFNLVAPDNDHSDQFQVFRARLGARGVLSAIDDRINYFVLGEVGNNGLTLEHNPVLTDASVTFNYIPGARIRAGLFKTPTGEEALEAVQVMDYINFSNVTDNLLNERFVEPYTVTPPRTAAPLSSALRSAQLTGATSGFRDVGVQVYDWFQRDKWEYTYAVMVSNGNGINFNDTNSKLDLTAHLQAAYIFGGKGPRREDATVYVWHQEGTRTFGTQDYNRVRDGVGVRYLKQPFRVSGEYMQGKGMIFNGPNPPFNDLGSGLQPVTTVGPEGKAHGWYLDGGWHITPKWEVDARYDEFNRMTNSAPDERKFTTWTAGLQYFFTPKLRVALNYEWRDLKVVNPSAITPAANQTNAEAVAASMGNRVSTQLTWVF